MSPAGVWRAGHDLDDHQGVTDPVDTRCRTGSPARTGRGLRRLGVLAVVLSFVGVWGYVLYLTFFEGRADLRDHLDDTEWVATAEATCAPTATAIEGLPLASELDSFDERAEVLDTATERLERMVRELQALAPPSEADEARAVERWLVDWEAYNQDRREYADRFRAGEDEPFRVTDRGGYQIDVLIDDFAIKANDMPSCATPDDVG